MASWQVQQAKSRLSELIEKANSEGPQTITKNGTETAVLVSIEDYKRLSSRQLSLSEHLMNFPKVDGFAELVDRDRELGREFDFSDE